MLESRIDFKNYTLQISPESGPTDSALVLFHGFPAEPVTDMAKEKNIDFGRYLCKSLMTTVYIPHFNGLGRNKGAEFSFIDSVKDSLELIEKLSLKHSNLMIVGHSWGGLVALNILKNFPSMISKILLQSPFVVIPSRKILEPVLNGLFSDLPHLTKDKSINDYLLEFDVLRKEFNPELIMKDFSFYGKALVLHAKNDDEIPLNTSIALASSLNWNYEIFDTNHGFWENREAFFKRSYEFFK